MPVCARCQRELGPDERVCTQCGNTLEVQVEAIPTPAPEADPGIGRTIGAKYRIDALLGRGGMGRVYRATDVGLDRPVAVKMLDSALLTDPTMAKRFQREARAATRLRHPNSVAVLDFGQAEDGQMFLVMELLGGRSLTRLIADEFPVGHDRVVRIGAQILAALTEAHAHGVLHCDLKPENVMVEQRRDEHDAVKVLDFGVAKIAEGGPALSRLTQIGSVCGTPGYMSPEQARGETLDPRTDLYSVGVILYELVTGKLPFDAETPIGLITRALTERPPRPSVRRPDVRVPIALEALIMRALATDRDDRPTTAEEFRESLLASIDASRGPAPAKAQGTVQFAAAPPAPARSTPNRTAATRNVPVKRRSGPIPTAAERRREIKSLLPALVASTAGALLIGGAVVLVLTRLGATAEQASTSSRDSVADFLTGAPDSLAMPPLASGAGLLTVFAPEGATVTVDGRAAGEAPREIQLPVGTHDVRAVHPILGVMRASIEVKAGQRSRWDVPFEKRARNP